MPFISSLKSAYRSNLVQVPLRKTRSFAGSDQRLITRYYGKAGLKCLHIGAGSNILPGWLNTNWGPIHNVGKGAILLDATRDFHFPDASFEYIFSEHMIEHVPFLGARKMLAECFRVLKPAGRIRIATPDMAFLMGLLEPKLSNLQEAYIEWSQQLFSREEQPAAPIAVVNNFVRDWGHQFIYDRAILQSSLERAGFTNCTFYASQESDDPLLRNIDFVSRMPEGFVALESMVCEAVKSPELSQ